MGGRWRKRLAGSDRPALIRAVAIGGALAVSPAVAQELAPPHPIDLGGRFLDGTGGGVRPPTPPQPIGAVGRWFGQDAYPIAAIRVGEQGRVVAVIAVDAKGRPTGCTVASSSGSATLDGTTCTIAMAHLTFTPARSGNGRAIVGQYRLPVRWLLPNPVMAGPLNLSVLTQITVATDGTIESCETEPALPPGAPGPCLAYPVGRKVMLPQQRDGRPVRARIAISMDIATILDP